MSTPQTHHLASGACGVPSKLWLSVLFITVLGEARQILAAPPHSPCDLQPVFELSMGKQAVISTEIRASNKQLLRPQHRFPARTKGVATGAAEPRLTPTPTVGPGSSSDFPASGLLHLRTPQ